MCAIKKRDVTMDNEARISRLLAVFNDLPDKDKEAVLALMEKLGCPAHAELAGLKGSL
jgi:hypothetical protein